VGRWERPLREFRARLGLSPTRALAQIEGQFSPRLHLALFSRLLAAPQPDWPAGTVTCGFPRYDGAAPARDKLAALEEFLAAGDPPIVIGLGSSAVMVAGNFWSHAIEAVEKLGRRAILLAGETAGALARVPPSIRIFDYLPYSAVFPRAAAIVHSGGIGTLAQALAAGRPQLITPVAFDQPDNARRAAALGLARTLPFRRTTAARLGRELAAVMADERCAARAREVGAVVSAEDGAWSAASALEGTAS
jgi:UDP:flavonoid glycosyltransferase YjiC (YdhE family)